MPPVLNVRGAPFGMVDRSAVKFVPLYGVKRLVDRM